jgi:hypothetical protein
MRELPDRPNLDQLRRQAKELHRRVIRGEPSAVRRMRGSKGTSLSAAQHALARDYGFSTWSGLKAEVELRRASGRVRNSANRGAASSTPARRDWRRMRDMMFSLLIKRTGQDVDTWRRKINRQQFHDQSALRAWLKAQGITGYSQMLLVWERFGYPNFMTAGVDDLIDQQYADRPALRPVLDGVLAALPRVGPTVVVQARKTYISLVSERRTFAVVQATTRHRIDLGLRLTNIKVAGRLERAKGVGNGSMTVKLSLASPKDLDREALVWLKRAYRENA